MLSYPLWCHRTHGWRWRLLEPSPQAGKINRKHTWCTVNKPFQSINYDHRIISSYWMRLSRIWRILQSKEGVIHRGRRPRWITSSEICRILHILRKPNSIIALLFIQNVSSFLKEFHHYALCFFHSQNITQPCPQLFLVKGSIICGGLHFWRHWFNNFWWAPPLTSLIQYGEDSFQIWLTAAGYGELCMWL